MSDANKPAAPTFTFGAPAASTAGTAGAPAPATFSFSSFSAAPSTGAPAGSQPSFSFGSAPAASAGGFSFTGFAAAPAPAAEEEDDGEDLDEALTNPQAKALVHLELVDVKTNEEDEEIMCEMRAKLFRMDNTEKDWKERGRGVVKLLKHRANGKTRILMRRDQTLKICCNHYVMAEMELKSNMSSDRSWIWTTNADFSDEEVSVEVLAIRFNTVADAEAFKKAFDEAKIANKAIFDAAKAASAASATTSTA